MYYPYLLVFHGIQRYNRNMSPTVWYLNITIFYRTPGTRHNFHFLVPKSPSSRCRTEKLIDHRFPFGEYVHQPRNQDKSGFPELGVIPKWMVKKGESPIKMDDLGVTPYTETPKWYPPGSSNVMGHWEISKQNGSFAVQIIYKIMAISRIFQATSDDPVGPVG